MTHVDKINNLIDAILDLEGYYEQLPSDLKVALDKANTLRNIAEEPIGQGDYVYDSQNHKAVIVISVNAKTFTVAQGELNKNNNTIDYIKGTSRDIKKQYCFKRPF